MDELVPPDSGYQLAGEGRILSSYFLTRYMILRLLGCIYAVAFLVAINQVVPLIGSRGLLPVGIYLEQVSESFGSSWAGFLQLPSLFWLGHSDQALMIMAWVGFLISCLVIAGYANAIMMFILWVIYMSFVHIGQEWYSYGWEIQLLETGFLAIFLCPLFDIRPFSRRPPPFAIIVLFRWLIFRIMLGSGLIKIRSDPSWRNATALFYHFQSQPIPGPFSRWFHFLPRSILKAGLCFNFIAELLAPWFIVWPRVLRHIGGVVIVSFQLGIILSGNLPFLNWLTIIPALACFDDLFWKRILPRRLVLRSAVAAADAQPSRVMLRTAWVITGIVAILSLQPALNLLSPGQVMNSSFNRLDLVNTYGAFGTVGQERLNVVFEGTLDNDSTDHANWQPYLYKGLPVLTNSRPRQIAPYHLRFDWQMWFAAMSTADDYPWTRLLVIRLLENDPLALSLFAANPFPLRPPRYVRAVLYRYGFARPGNSAGDWWKRQRIGLWLGPVSLPGKN